MRAQTDSKSASALIVAIFATFCLANVLLLAIALLMAFKNSTLQLIPEEVGFGIRMLIFLIGTGLSWALGRWLYMRMVQGEIRVPESATAALVMTAYLLLTFASLAFIGGFSWIWQSLFLLVLFLMTLLALGPVIGTLASMSVIALCLLAGAGLFFMLS